MTEKRIDAIIADLESLKHEPGAAISETDVSVKELLELAKLAKARKAQVKNEQAAIRKGKK